MVQVRLEWTPDFEVGQKFKLDSVFIDTVIPAIPLMDQLFLISSFVRLEDDTWEETADYYHFHVGKVEYILEGPSKLVRADITLRLGGKNAESHEYQESVVDDLLQNYEWEADE